MINGESLLPSDLKKFPVRSAKNNDKTIYHAVSANVAQAMNAVDSASAAFQTWKNTTAVERRDILFKAADLILERKDAFVKAQMDETSSSEFWADLNATVGSSHIREIASRITSMSGVIPQSKMEYAFAFREPLGVTLAIPP